MTFAGKIADNLLDTLLRGRKSVFRHPMDPAPRTAVLAACFRKAGVRRKNPIRLLPGGWSEAVSAFGPQAIAASREQLFSIADADCPPVLTHALIALAHPGDPILSLSDRERLWRVFRVPVFQQIIGANGQLLAAECEAHQGLHIEVPGFSREGHRIEISACACGRKTPRLVPVESVEDASRAAARAR